MKKYFLVILTLCASFCMAADTAPPANPDTLFPKDIPVTDVSTLVQNDSDQYNAALTMASISIGSENRSLTLEKGILPDNPAVFWYKLQNGNTIITQNKGPITNTWTVGPDNKLISANTAAISKGSVSLWVYDGSGSLTFVAQGTQTWDLTKPSTTTLIDAAAVPKTVNKEKVFNK